MSDLIDTTEMYLRTVYELREEGITPLRARIAERLGQSGPTVSQTVARMERDGLLHVERDRHLELTPRGEREAVRVMRKHRLAECMLVDVLKLPWEEVHAEACRWEHVMSDVVELRILELLDHPTVSPYGNPIPGLAELDPSASDVLAGLDGLVPLPDVVSGEPKRVRVRRLAETIQTDESAMTKLRRVGSRPGADVKAYLTSEGVMIGSGGEYVEIPTEEARHILVEADD
ncbi:MAG TPA: iron dependent repressor, metal binding and dimerization domain protein [Candidatus Nanopelagicales bacterium]|nr:iron dependent repressor, metal binding and dimerization domain protein [Candidatus Nanopelagicales bacterium]